MFLDTLSNRFLSDKKYEVLYPPTYGVYTGRLDYLKASGKFWSARVSDCIIAHKGKIFIGNGDYDKNTGDCPICSYDPLTDQWTVEGTLPTEHILNIREIDDTLWIPCQDHTGGDVDARVFRRKSDGTWETISISFPAQHSFDIAKIDGKIWMDIAQVPDTNKAAVAVSNDGGITWGKVQCYEADGITLPNVTRGEPNRIESGIFLANGEIYALDSLGPSQSFTAVFKYNQAQNKFLRVTNNFVPSGVGVTNRFIFDLLRVVLPQRYENADPGAMVFTPSLFRVEAAFQGKTFISSRRWFTLSNAADRYTGSNLYKELYYSNSHMLYVPSAEAAMYDFYPEMLGFASGSWVASRDEGEYRYYTNRDIIDICVFGERLYVMQVSVKDGYYRRISDNAYMGKNPNPITISILSIADESAYRLEFESTFPTWPTRFTVLDGFAYICMGGDIHLESHWIGAVVKAKLNG